MHARFARQVVISRSIKLAVFGLAAILVPQFALAQDEPPKPSIKFMDADGDDAITRTEWSKFAQAFSQLDADKDNNLSTDELSGTGASAKLLTDLADLNSDGKVTRTEWTRLIQNFTRWDANKDKNLDLAELTQAADSALASAKGTAKLPGASNTKGRPTGPTLWRGSIDGRGEIELLVNGTVVTGREVNGGRGGNSLGTGTIVMTGNGTTGNMDATYTDGPNQGEVCLGIYQLQGDRLLWCVNNRGGRPQGLQGGGGNWLMTLNKVPYDPAALNR